MVDGGVYTPAIEIVPTVLFPPATPFTFHVTDELVRLVTVTVKLSVLPKRTWLAPEMVTEGCCCWVEFPPVEEPQPLMKIVTPSANAVARTRPRNLRFTGRPPYGGEKGPASKGGTWASWYEPCARGKVALIWGIILKPCATRRCSLSEQQAIVPQNFASKSLNLRSSSHSAAALSLLSRNVLHAVAGFSPPNAWLLHASTGALNSSGLAHKLAPGKKLCSRPVRASCFRSA